jgi:hypothetical protein
MDPSIVNPTLMNHLLHERNLILVKNVTDMSIKNKRKIFACLRQLPNNQSLNFLFPVYFGVTIAEFCTIQVLLNDSKRKFRDSINKQYKDLNIGLFQET